MKYVLWLMKVIMLQKNYSSVVKIMLIYENLSKIAVRNIETQSRTLLKSNHVFLLDVILNV